MTDKILEAGSSTASQALVATGILVTSISRVGGGGTPAENGVSEALKVLSHCIPGGSLRLSSADCGIFSKEYSRRLIAWLEEGGVPSSNHLFHDQVPTEKEEVRDMEKIFGRWGHGTFGLVNNFENEAYLEGKVSEDENAYFKASEFRSACRQLKRAELINLVTNALKRDETKSSDGTADKWAHSLGEELVQWDGDAIPADIEPEIIWRGINRGPRTLSQLARVEDIAGALGLEESAIVKDWRWEALCEDLMKRYIAYKCAAYTLRLLHKDLSNRVVIISGYSRSSLLGVLKISRGLEAVNSYSVQHSQHTGTSGAFSIKKEFSWYGGLWRRTLEGAIAAIFAFTLRTGPLASLTGARRVLTFSDAIYLTDVPCIDDSIREIRIYSISNERDEWWAVATMHSPVVTGVMMTLAAFIEIIPVSLVWFLGSSPNKNTGDVVSFVCEHPVPVNAILASLLFVAGVTVFLVRTRKVTLHSVPKRVDTGNLEWRFNLHEFIFFLVTCALAAWFIVDAIFYTFSQVTAEACAFLLWAAGELLTVHNRRGRTFVSHEVIAFLIAAFSVYVGQSC